MCGLALWYSLLRKFGKLKISLQVLLKKQHENCVLCNFGEHLFISYFIMFNDVRKFHNSLQVLMFSVLS